MQDFFCKTVDQSKSKNINSEKRFNPITIDLFCGCGGMSLGFQNAGYNIVAAFDNWDSAIDIYRKNFKHPVFKKDLNQFKESDFNILKGEYKLKIEKNIEYCTAFYEVLVDRKMDIFKYVQAYYRCFMQNKGIENYPQFIV